MVEVVVAEHALLAARVPDAGDHRGVVEFVGEDHAAGEQLAERRQRRLVRDIAGGEQQRAFLAVEVGELGLELDMIMGVAADVAGAAGAGADVVQRVLHRLDHRRVLAHAEIVVRAPDGDRLGAVVAGEAARVGEAALGAQDVDEHAVAPFVVKPVDRGLEDAVVVQPGPRSRPFSAADCGNAIANDSQQSFRVCGFLAGRSARASGAGPRPAAAPVNDGDARAGRGGPGLVAGQIGDAPRDPGAAVDQRDAREGGAQAPRRAAGNGCRRGRRRRSGRRRARRTSAATAARTASTVDASRRRAWPRPARPARASRGGSPCSRRRSSAARSST